MVRSTAEEWMTEALLIGNGEMGAMIFGSLPEDRYRSLKSRFGREVPVLILNTAAETGPELIRLFLKFENF